MEVIQSFTIDHTQLKPGIYVSRVDKGFTTYDLRITADGYRTKTFENISVDTSVNLDDIPLERL